MTPTRTPAIFGTLLAFTLTACTATPQPTTPTTDDAAAPRDNNDITRVTKIIDGNTLTAQHAGHTVTTLTETVNRTATSKRGAYTHAQQAEEGKKQQEQPAPNSTATPTSKPAETKPSPTP